MYRWGRCGHRLLLQKLSGAHHKVNSLPREAVRNSTRTSLEGAAARRQPRSAASFTSLATRRLAGPWSEDVRQPTYVSNLLSCPIFVKVLTVNADDHELFKHFHKLGDERRIARTSPGLSGLDAGQHTMYCQCIHHYSWNTMTRLHSLSTFTRCLSRSLTHTNFLVCSIARSLGLRPIILQRNWARGSQWS